MGPACVNRGLFHRSTRQPAPATLCISRLPIHGRKVPSAMACRVGSLPLSHGHFGQCGQQASQHPHAPRDNGCPRRSCCTRTRAELARNGEVRRATEMADEARNYAAAYIQDRQSIVQKMFHRPGGFCRSVHLCVVKSGHMLTCRTHV